MNDVKAQSQLTGMAATTAADIVTEKKAGRQAERPKNPRVDSKTALFLSIVRYTHTHTYTKGIQTGLLDKNAAGVSLFSDQLPPPHIQNEKLLYALKFSLVLKSGSLYFFFWGFGCKNKLTPDSLSPIIISFGCDYIASYCSADMSPVYVYYGKWRERETCVPEITEADIRSLLNSLYVCIRCPSVA